ncbi:hypothetical protein [Actinopolymorpha sp. B9G3]|uniref:hypothetical protein n=1 Tax=Actinopolymorpha sp. B9G3 TaxID=3158970 RepID=UPI0032D9504B
MTITTTAPHGLLLESLSRLTVLVREHRDELPELVVFLSSDRSQVDVQVVEYGAAEAVRRDAVDHLAQLLKLEPPKERDYGHYRTANDLWDIYTPIATD